MTEKAGTKHGTLAFALDFGPLLIFFLAYRLADPKLNPLSATIKGTIAFMIAIALAVIVSRWKLGRVSPMMWLSAVLVIGFGSLTIWFNDPSFIQIKPTIIYAFFAGALGIGLLRGKALLRMMLQNAYDGLDEAGWMKLSRNWALFFAAMAALNEVMRATLSFDTWLTVKVWGITALSFVFALANLPMMMKHGLGAEEVKGTDPVPPQG